MAALQQGSAASEELTRAINNVSFSDVESASPGQTERLPDNRQDVKTSLTDPPCIEGQKVSE